MEEYNRYRLISRTSIGQEEYITMSPAEDEICPATVAGWSTEGMALFNVALVPANLRTFFEVEELVGTNGVNPIHLRAGTIVKRILQIPGIPWEEEIPEDWLRDELENDYFAERLGFMSEELHPALRKSFLPVIFVINGEYPTDKPVPGTEITFESEEWRGGLGGSTLSRYKHIFASSGYVLESESRYIERMKDMVGITDYVNRASEANNSKLSQPPLSYFGGVDVVDAIPLNLIPQVLHHLIETTPFDILKLVYQTDLSKFQELELKLTEEAKSRGITEASEIEDFMLNSQAEYNVHVHLVKVINNMSNGLFFPAGDGRICFFRPEVINEFEKYCRDCQEVTGRDYLDLTNLQQQYDVLYRFAKQPRAKDDTLIAQAKEAGIDEIEIKLVRHECRILDRQQEIIPALVRSMGGRAVIYQI